MSDLIGIPRSEAPRVSIVVPSAVDPGDGFSATSSSRPDSFGMAEFSPGSSSDGATAACAAAHLHRNVRLDWQ